MVGLLLSQSETALTFPCQQESLVGILHCPEKVSTVGVVIVVGGPQYRVGSHRQFVHLARALAQSGIAVFRFDCRGMGDSEGEFPSFDAIDADIESAIDAFMQQVPALQKVVIWGLCDGASAACFYAPNDTRVKGLVLVNPWVRTEQGAANAYIKHYYLSRILSGAFWRKVFAGKFDVTASFKSLKNLLVQSAGKPQTRVAKSNESASTKDVVSQASTLSLPDRVFEGLKQFEGQVLLIISSRDLTAAEFVDAANQVRARRRLLGSKRFSRTEIIDADHTFSKQSWKNEVAEKTLQWLKTL